MESRAILFALAAVFAAFGCTSEDTEVVVEPDSSAGGSATGGSGGAPAQGGAAGEAGEAGAADAAAAGNAGAAGSETDAAADAATAGAAGTQEDAAVEGNAGSSGAQEAAADALEEESNAADACAKNDATECIPGQSRCLNATPETCDSAGRWHPTSLDTDVHHCGACGHDCQGGSCSAGKCQPFLLIKQVNVSGMAVDAGGLYWTSCSCPQPGECSGSLHKMRPDGSGLTALLSDLSGCPTEISSDATAVFWVQNSGDSSLDSWSLAWTGSTGGPRIELVSGSSGYADQIALDSSHIYWSVLSKDNTTTLHRITRSGSGFVPVWSGATEVVDIAQSSAGVFLVAHDNATGVSSIIKQGRNGEGAITLASEAGVISGIAVDDYFAYWGERSTGEVRKVSVEGAAPITLMNGPALQFGIALDAANVYAMGSELMTRVGIDGGEPEVVTSYVAGRKAVMDSHSIYIWVNTFCAVGGCTGDIIKIAR